jgi:DNA-binding transcriptional LysR family regulator
MKFEEKHLVHLAAVIEYGGVTAAAEQLGLSQPAVSRTLSALEKRVGEPLFQPGRRPLRPTVIGAELGRHGRVILEAAREAAETMSSFRSGSSGKVRIAGVPFFMDAFISGMIGGFQRIEPDILVEQGYGNLQDLENGIASKRLDLAICPLGAIKPKPEFRFTPILKARNVIACRQGHPLLRGKKLNRTDVADFPWVAPLPGSPLMADLHTVLLNLGLQEISIRYSGGSLLSVLNYLEETDALTILPHSVTFAHRKDRKVTVLPLDIPQPPRSLGILRAREAQQPAAEHLVAHILKEFDALRAAIERHQTSVVWGP